VGARAGSNQYKRDEDKIILSIHGIVVLCEVERSTG